MNQGNIFKRKVSCRGIRWFRDCDTVAPDDGHKKMWRPCLDSSSSLFVFIGALLGVLDCHPQLCFSSKYFARLFGGCGNSDRLVLRSSTHRAIRVSFYLCLAIPLFASNQQHVQHRRRSDRRHAIKWCPRGGRCCVFPSSAIRGLISRLSCHFNLWLVYYGTHTHKLWSFAGFFYFHSHLGVSSISFRVTIATRQKLVNRRGRTGSRRRRRCFCQKEKPLAL